MSTSNTLSDLSPIIIIDDDDFFQVAIATVLRERFGVETVVVCGTSMEAIAELQSGTLFGLALVDLNMPGTENKELLNTLKSAQPDICLVVLSASKSRDDIFMTLSAGAQGFINKGLGIGETEAALQQIADGAVYVPPFTAKSVDDRTAPGTEDSEPTISLSALTPRQLEVLRLLVAGHSNKGIARELGINHSTVKFHLAFVFQILGVSNRVEAAMLGATMLKKNQ